MLKLAAAALLIVAPKCMAQVEHEGSPYVLKASFKAQAGLSELPLVDLKGRFSLTEEHEMIKEDSQGRTDYAKPLRIAKVIDVGADFSDFTSDTMPDGTLYRLAITSPRAYGIGLNFEHFTLPEGAKMFVHSPTGTTVRGAFTSGNHKHYGGLSVMPVQGDTVVIEVQVPEGADQPNIVVESIAHHYKPTMFKQPQTKVPFAEGPLCFGCSGACNVNNNCPSGEDWVSESAGVVRLLTASGSSLCSGSMINNVEQDGRQLFLSADHCGGGSADGWILMFNYDSATCENTVEPSRDQTVQGTRLLARRGLSDFVLLEVTETIPSAYNAYLNGFDATEGNTFQVPFAISHPSGDVKKIAIWPGEAVPEGYFQPGDTHWYIAGWEDVGDGRGVTEGGSSGSPIFDNQKRIRGQLHGGRASCSYPYVDYYGRTYTSWDDSSDPEEQLAAHLDRTGSGTRVVDGQPLNALRAKQQ